MGLTLHGVPDIEYPLVNTPPILFMEYLQYLSDYKFKAISLKDLEAYIDVDEAKGTSVLDLSKKFNN